MAEEPLDSIDSGRPTVIRWIVAFGRFWWDFLIGDTPELFVCTVAVIVAVAVVCLQPGLRTAAAFVMPVLVAAVLVASVGRAARRARRNQSQ